MKTEVFFNLDASPWLPCDTWQVTKNENHGFWNYDIDDLEVIFPKKHQKKYPTLEEMLEKFDGRQVNSNFIECLFEHQDLISDLIPENDRGVELIFLGTVFYNPRLGESYVRALFLPKFVPDYVLTSTEELIESEEDRKKPHWICKGLKDEFGPNCRVVVFKKEKEKRVSFLRRIAAFF